MTDRASRIPAPWAALAARSRALLAAAQDPSGAWPASPGFAPYQFSWFRDGSFIADGASAGGLHDQASAFHSWCAGVLLREEPAIRRAEQAAAAGVVLDDADYLPARYNLDGSRHDDDWWNFQVDGYGSWLWSLERHARRAGTDVAGLEPAVYLAARYLVATGLGSCRDWWEENRDQVHVTTLAGVAAGLRAAPRLPGTRWPAELADAAEQTAAAATALIRDRGTSDGHLVKWLDGQEVDASLLSVSALYGVRPASDPVISSTGELVDRLLTTGPGPTGVHRYEADVFYGGGQWPVLACLLATHHLNAGERRRAAELLDWVAATADDDWLLPEQTGPRLAPDRLPEWEERWGPSAHPLLWSHGAFLSALEAWDR